MQLFRGGELVQNKNSLVIFRFRFAGDNKTLFKRNEKDLVLIFLVKISILMSIALVNVSIIKIITI